MKKTDWDDPDPCAGDDMSNIRMCTSFEFNFALPRCHACPHDKDCTAPEEYQSKARELSKIALQIEKKLERAKKIIDSMESLESDPKVKVSKRR